MTKTIFSYSTKMNISIGNFIQNVNRILASRICLLLTNNNLHIFEPNLFLYIKDTLDHHSICLNSLHQK